MMSSRKILDEKKINWNRNDQATLSYRMIFDEIHPETQVEEEAPDYEQILEDTNREWEERLKKARQEAFEAGVAEGEESGYQRAASELDNKLIKIESHLQKAHHEWQERQKMIDPGVLDMAFDLAGAILQVPVENPEIRKNLEQELGPLLQRIDETTKPVLWISEHDQELINDIREDYAPGATVNVRVNSELNTGEFKLETSRETVVHKFNVMLQDLKDSLTLPSWTQ